MGSGNSYIPGVLPAVLNWNEFDQPVSVEHQDIYFPKNGVEAARHVFIEPNDLVRRLQSQQQIVVAELGFGTGLNFLTLWKQWRELRSKSTLHFISIEKSPLKKADLARSLQQWVEFSDLSNQLIEIYPPLLRGPHRLIFESGKVVLTVYFDTSEAVFPQLNFPVDCWFLDGFDPKQNQDFWNDETVKHIARLSDAGTTLGTWCAAGFLRRSLEAVGFSVEKFSGFEGKRESIKATFNAPTCIENSKPQNVAIIGAGLAGLTLRERLANFGVATTLFESGPKVGSGASGNWQGMLMPYFGQTEWAYAQFMPLAYEFSRRFLSRFDPNDIELRNFPLVQFPRYERLQKLIDNFTNLAMPADFAEVIDAKVLFDLTALKLDSKALLFPGAFAVNPARLCEALAHLSKDPIVYNSEIVDLQYEDSWILTSSTGEKSDGFDAVVVANAAAAKKLPPLASLNLNKVRGQVIKVPANEVSENLKAAFCYEGYCIPAETGFHTIGSSYVHGTESTDYSEQESSQILELANRYGFNFSLDTNNISGRASFRATTRDKMPYVGAFPNQKHLYVHVGYGSRGITAIPLCSEIIASKILNHPSPVTHHLETALSPTASRLSS